jgi:hypothetical protein
MNLRRIPRTDRDTPHTRHVAVNKLHLTASGDIGAAQVQKFCQLDKNGLAMIRMAVEA